MDVVAKNIRDRIRDLIQGSCRGWGAKDLFLISTESQRGSGSWICYRAAMIVRGLLVKWQKFCSTSESSRIGGRVMEWKEDRFWNWHQEKILWNKKERAHLSDFEEDEWAFLGQVPGTWQTPGNWHLVFPLIFGSANFSEDHLTGLGVTFFKKMNFWRCRSRHDHYRGFSQNPSLRSWLRE